MKLYHSPASPYARKVRAVAKECGITPELVPTDPRGDAVYGKINPLQRIPALVLDDGEVLFDSPVIAEYLDATDHAGPKLFPAGGPARFRALKLQAMADGICDAAVPCRHETLRPKALQSEAQIALYKRSMRQALDALENMSVALEGVTIGTIAVACALGYLDFRFPDEAWREGRPKLAAWFETFAKRPSLSETAPTA